MAEGYKSSLIASLRGNAPAAPVMGSGPAMGVGPMALNYGWMQNPNTTPISFTPPERVRLNRPERIESQGMTERQVAEERMRDILGTSFNPLNGLPPNMQEAMSRMAEEFGPNQFDQYVNAPVSPPLPPPPPPPANVTRSFETVTPDDFAELANVAQTIEVPQDIAPMAPVDMYEPGFDLDSLNFVQVDEPQMAPPPPPPAPRVAPPVQPSPILPVSPLQPLPEEFVLPMLPETLEEIEAMYVADREVTPEEIERQLMMNPMYFNFLR